MSKIFDIHQTTAQRWLVRYGIERNTDHRKALVEDLRKKKLCKKLSKLSMSESQLKGFKKLSKIL